MTLVCAATLVLALEAASARAQDWSQYFAFEDFFNIEFPGEPIVRDTTYETEFDITLPARVYSAEDDFGMYSLTVVDWREAPALHDARYRACVASTSGDSQNSCTRNQARSEIGGAMLHAVSKILTRGGEVTYLGQMDSEEVEGVRIHLINNDGARTFGAAHWHEDRLYVIEATTLVGAPPPNSFLVSIGFVDEEGRRVRYEERYSPLMPTPARSR